MVASKVAKALGVAHRSAGDFMRELAEERGMSILELSRQAEEDPSIDEEIDARSARLAAEGVSFVMDARLGWHFVPRSVKVFLEVRPEVAAERIFRAGRGSERENTDLETTRRAIDWRTASETARYHEYYGIDYADHGHYDLVVDTTDLTADQVVELILEHVESAGSGPGAGGEVP